MYMKADFLRGILKGIVENINDIFMYRARRRLNNRNPTIICNNCLGGVIYHRLGLRFNSPTINLFFNSNEYVDFCYNFRLYLSCELENISQEENRPFPVGCLNPRDGVHSPVRLYFNHSDSFQHAKEEWDSRCGRVNHDNIIFLYEYYHTDFPFEDIKRFDDLEENHLALTHQHIEGIKNQVSIYCYKERERPYAKIMSYKFFPKKWVDDWDYVGTLNEIK